MRDAATAGAPYWAPVLSLALCTASMTVGYAVDAARLGYTPGTICANSMLTCMAAHVRLLPATHLLSLVAALACAARCGARAQSKALALKYAVEAAAGLAGMMLADPLAQAAGLSIQAIFGLLLMLVGMTCGVMGVRLAAALASAAYRFLAPAAGDLPSAMVGRALFNAIGRNPCSP